MASFAFASTDARGKLSETAKSIAFHTSQLVLAAKASVEGEEPEDEDGKEQEGESDDEAEEEKFSFIGSKAKEMEQQMKIMKLEKDLTRAREELGGIRKQEYRHKKKESKSKP
jgi:hypothetical protein